MANLAEKNQADPKAQDPRKPAIATREHELGQMLGHHMAPATPNLADVPRAGIAPPRDPRQTLRNMQALQMGSPMPNGTSLYSLSLNLQQNLFAWKPTSKKQTALKKSLGRELNVLNDVLFQESLEQEIEVSKSVSHKLIADPSSPSAPSLEILREDLAALAADDPAMSTLPPGLAVAVKKFQEGFDQCFAEQSQPKHPLVHAHAHPAATAEET